MERPAIPPPKMATESSLPRGALGVVGVAIVFAFAFDMRLVNGSRGNWAEEERDDNDLISRTLG